MSNDQALIQVNLKSGVDYDATLINVYAKTGTELVQLLEAVKENAPLIAEAQAVVKLTHNVGVEQGSVQTQVEQPPAQQGFTVPQMPNQGPPPAQQTNAGWGAPQGTPPPSFANPAQQAPTCQHGARVFREGNGAKGPWKAWFCPTPKGTPGQCDAQFVK